MSDVVTISSRLTNLEVSPQFNSYSKVRIIVSEDTVYEVGNDDGRTLEIENPFGTQAMAQTILNSLSGFQYQPYQADGALLDPAAEIGDAANMRGNYGGIYTRDRNFGRLMKADISAPCDEEINHEYAYESPEERQFTRSVNNVKASLRIANDRIDASVAQTGGDNSTFGWSLNSTAHTWYANGQEVMKVTASGLSVKGNVEATSGKIGGFAIGASAIYNNISSFGGSQSTGVYVGTDGIQLGQAFKVTSSGAVTATNISANNMTLTGTLNIGGTNITAAALRGGAQTAYTNGGTWSGTSTAWSNATRSGTGSYPSSFTASGIFAKGTLQSAGTLVVNGAATLKSSLSVASSSLSLGGTSLSIKHATIGGTTIHYLGY